MTSAAAGATPTAHEHPTTLYSFWRSSCSYRVRIALNVKRVPYSYRAVNILDPQSGGEQFADAFSELNPVREVPVLEIDGMRFSQSVAICEYLDETRDGDSDGTAARLLPTDAADRARVRELVQVVNAGIQPVQNTSVVKRVGTLCAPRGGDDASRVKAAWMRETIERGLHALERMVQRTSTARRFCFGDHLTLADVFLVPQACNAERAGIDLGAFPALHSIVAALRELPEFAAAHPDRQPDAPQEARA